MTATPMVWVVLCIRELLCCERSVMLVCWLGLSDMVLLD